MTETSSAPSPSPTSRRVPTNTRASNALQRKRERDKQSQRRKREKEKAYAASLEQKVAVLERRLALAEGPSSADASLGHSRLAEGDTSPSPSQSSPDQLMPWPSHTPVETSSGGYIDLCPPLTSHEAISDQLDAVLVEQANSTSLPAQASCSDALSLPLAYDMSVSSPNGFNISAFESACVPAGSDSDFIHDRPQLSSPSGASQINNPFLSPASVATPQAPSIRPPLNPSMITMSALNLEFLLQTPLWLRLPLHSTSTELPFPSLHETDFSGSLDCAISQVVATMDNRSPVHDVPRVVDILFGGSSNMIANVIASAARHVPSLTEQLGAAWLGYLLTKWQLYPSKDSFMRLPRHYRPTVLQLAQPHAFIIDLLPWPQLRDNLIMYTAPYNLQGVLSAIASSFRLVHPPVETVVTRKADSDPELNDQFREQIVCPTAWGLLESFWQKHPKLVAGLDHSLCIKQ